MGQDFLIVGLGNYGKEYDNTRHNLGFLQLDRFAQGYQVAYQLKKELKGEVARLVVQNHPVILLKPSTYMNLSGESVKKVVEYFKVTLDKVLIISDDADLPVGQIRLRSGGSSGGHNGLKNIEHHLGTRVYYRMKIGIGKHLDQSLADYVLSRFSQKEIEDFEPVLEAGQKIIHAFIEKGYSGALDELASWCQSQKAN